MSDGRPFAHAEYDERLRRTRAAMADHGLDVLVVVDPSNLNYLTGYDAWSFYTPQALVVPAEGALLFCIRPQDAPAVVLTTDLAEDQVLGYPEELIHHRTRHAMDHLAAELVARGLGGGRLGVESDAHFFSPRAQAALVAGLPGADVVDSGELVNWVRAVKSPAEVELLRIAGRAAERVMAVAVDAIRPGVRQCDAAAAISRAQIEGGADGGGDYPAIVPMLPTGEGTRTPHLTWTERPFRTGEATVLELAACHRRYHAPIARTVVLGTPPAPLARLAEATVEGLEHALDAVRPGVTCEGVEEAWRRSIARHGLSKPSRVGYSIGIGYPPDWGERTMSLRPGDTTELRPGMAFHLMCGMWRDDAGLEISQAFVVGPDGAADPLYDVPRDLIERA